MDIRLGRSSVVAPCAGRWLSLLLGCVAVLAGASGPPQTQAQQRLASARTVPFRAAFLGGNWGSVAQNRDTPPDGFFVWLRSLNVNWVALSVALHVSDSMDSNVRPEYSGVQISTFTDATLDKLIRRLRQEGFQVYLTLAFEIAEAERSSRPVFRWQFGDPSVPQGVDPANWPWNPKHPDYAAFTAGFWRTYTEQAVHYAQIAEAAGGGMFSLGTETDRLFRTRAGGGGGAWDNHFKAELLEMAGKVREVYSGILTYDMHYSAVTSTYYGAGSDYLWQDLGLDLVGVSAYFPLADTTPDLPLTQDTIDRAWSGVFQKYLVPLQERNPSLPIVFTEFGYTDSVASPYQPNAEEATTRRYTDRDGDGLDDGEVTQARLYGGLAHAMDLYPSVVSGAFLWNFGLASPAQYASSEGRTRSFNVRGKLAEPVVRDWYTRAATQPKLALSSASYTFSHRLGTPLPEAVPVSVANVGGGTVSWTAVSDAPWLLVAPSEGAAPGEFSIAIEPGGLKRGSYTASVTVSGDGAIPAVLPITLDLSACTYTVDSTAHVRDAEAGSGTFRLTTQAGCLWSVASGSSAAWLTLSSASSGQGSATIEYAVASHSDPEWRNAWMSLGNGITLRIYQAPSLGPGVLGVTRVTPAPAIGAVGGSAVRFSVEAQALAPASIEYVWTLDGSMVEGARAAAWQWSIPRAAAGIHTVSVKISSGSSVATTDWMVNVAPYRPPRILFDETHSERNTLSPDRARVLNPDHPDWVWFGILQSALADDTQVIAKTEGEIDAAALDAIDVLVLAAPTRSFTPAEQRAIRLFVESGGGLIYLGDAWSGSPMSPLLDSWGIRFVPATVLSSTNPGCPGCFRLKTFGDHPAVGSQPSFDTNYGGSFAVTAPAISIGETGDTEWRSLTGKSTQQAGETSGPLSMIAAAELEEGRVLAVSDNAFHDDYLRGRTGNTALFRSALAWVAAHANPVPPAGDPDEQP
jgi:hypothetical protein